MNILPSKKSLCLAALLIFTPLCSHALDVDNEAQLAAQITAENEAIHTVDTYYVSGGELNIKDLHSFNVELLNNGTVDLSNVTGDVNIAARAILNIIPLGGSDASSAGQTITCIDDENTLTLDCDTIPVNGVPDATLFCFTITDQIIGDDLQLIITEVFPNDLIEDCDTETNTSP